MQVCHRLGHALRVLREGEGREGGKEKQKGERSGWGRGGGNRR